MSSEVIHASPSHPFRYLIIWGILFSVGTVGLIGVFKSLPEDEEIGSIMSILPTNLSQLKKFQDSLIRYTDTHTIPVCIAFSLTYIYKQVFSIPGSVLMNLIGGVIFGLWIAFPLCCILSTAGASGCYWLSHFLGREIIEYYMPSKLATLQKKVISQDSGLLPFLICIRMFPFTPNWFINLASPIISVPFLPFLISVFIGLLPYNYITVQAGSLVMELQSTKDIFTTATVCKLLFVSLFFFSLPIIKKYIVPKVIFYYF